MAASPSPGVYRRLRNLRPKLDVVLDSQLRQCPFTVDRIALAGKELWNDVGQWGPSTAAGAIKCVNVAVVADCMLTSLYFSRSLLQSSSAASLGILVAVDGQIFQMDVYLANSSSLLVIEMGRTSGHRGHRYSAWNRRCQPDLMRRYRCVDSLHLSLEFD